MRIHVNRWFSRWAHKEGLAALALCRAASEMAEGLFDADLGGGLFKKRVARAGQGKSGGYRTLVASNRGDRWVFIYGFPKNVRSNIDAGEQAALKRLAVELLGLTPQALALAVAAGELTEVNCDAQDEVPHS
jgi:hypothetical protein